MRAYDIPYVQNPASPTVQKPLEEMDLREITRTRLVNCVKSNGLVSKCRDCTSKCADGIQAVNLAYGKFTPQDEPPLEYAGTLLEKARQAAAEQRLAKERKTVETQQTKTPKKNKGIVVFSDGRKFMEGWYEKALRQKEPLKWIMETFELPNMLAARQRVSAYLYKHPDAKVIKGYNRRKTHKPEGAKAVEEIPVKETPVEEPFVEEALVEEVVQEEAGPMEAVPETVCAEQENQATLSPIENKLNDLMNEQEKLKKEADRYLEMYNGLMAKHDEVQKQADILCEALNILNKS